MVAADPLDTDATRYLLGELPEAERDAFEERVLADDELHEQVKAAEDELFDAYAEGALAGDRRLRFEAHFLHDAAGARRLAAARAILAAAATYRPRAWYAAPRVWLAGLVAAAAAIALLVWTARGGREQRTGVVTVALIAPTRGADAPVVRLGHAAQLRLEPDVDSAAEAIVHGPNGARVHATLIPGPPPIVVIDAGDLTPGTYTLSILPRGGALVELPFTVAPEAAGE
ncbi:MAG TPA: hypothetical protein VL463_03620 [Kofleriaceae bacterium]|jgi:hypothetical protein|nr:hypothetical protein [Kofleriaceae bacterium]